MKFSILASAFALTSAVTANKCLCGDEAQQIVDRFSGILSLQGSDLGDANATAEALLADSFYAVSDSILSLEHLPLGGDSASSKAAYIAGTAHAPPDTNITTLEIVHSCDKIVWYWLFPNVGSGEYEVKGFNLFHIDTESSPQQITALFVEFNSIAWGIDTGENCANSTAKRM